MVCSFHLETKGASDLVWWGRRGTTHERPLRPAMVKAAGVFIRRRLSRGRITHETDQVAWRASYSSPRPLVCHAGRSAGRDWSCGQAIQPGRDTGVDIIRSDRPELWGVKRRRRGDGSRSALGVTSAALAAVVSPTAVAGQPY